jgi:NADH:ubiquinone oxidoreductase subunit 4 (subunit M)
MRESRKEVPVAPVSFGLATALGVSIFATLYLGILPNRILQLAQHSAQDLIPQAQAAAAQIQQPAPTSAH